MYGSSEVEMNGKVWLWWQLLFPLRAWKKQVRRWGTTLHAVQVQSLWLGEGCSEGEQVRKGSYKERVRKCTLRLELVYPDKRSQQENLAVSFSLPMGVVR